MAGSVDHHEMQRARDELRRLVALIRHQIHTRDRFAMLGHDIRRMRHIAHVMILQYEDARVGSERRIIQ